ncbi:hypothetical protein SBV1_560018 [Verrucomicrobia bacterium]|nr:hypothetical protein SBV1_560018 [Verrucomicrobiota bacterium]
MRMGYETRLSQTVREIESSPEPAVMEMKKRLAKSVL